MGNVNYQVRKYKKQINEFFENDEDEIFVDTKNRILDFVLQIIKSEIIAKEHFIKQSTNTLIRLSDINDKGL
jgi:hypothetical protein